MRKLISLTALLSFCYFFSYAEDIQYFSSNFNLVHQSAKVDKKPLLLLFSDNDDQKSMLFEKYTMSNETIVEYLHNDAYYCYRAEKKSKAFQEHFEEMGIQALPALVVINPDGSFDKLNLEKLNVPNVLFALKEQKKEEMPKQLVIEVETSLPQANIVIEQIVAYEASPQIEKIVEPNAQRLVKVQLGVYSDLNNAQRKLNVVSKITKVNAKLIEVNRKGKMCYQVYYEPDAFYQVEEILEKNQIATNKIY